MLQASVLVGLQFGGGRGLESEAFGRTQRPGIPAIPELLGALGSAALPLATSALEARRERGPVSAALRAKRSGGVGKTSPLNTLQGSYVGRHYLPKATCLTRLRVNVCVSSRQGPSYFATLIATFEENLS